MENKIKTINTSMLDIYKIEIETQSKILASNILLLEDSSAPDDIYETLINASRAIKGAVNLVRIDLVAPIIELLEKVFTHFKSNNISLNDDAKEALEQTLEILSLTSALSADQLNTPDTQISASVSHCLQQLQPLLCIKAETKAALNSSNEATLSNEDYFSIAKNIDSEMFELFKTELNNCINTINNKLLETDVNTNAKNLEAMMRAAHSIKGAARMIGFDAVVKISHVMEDVFVAAQKQQIELTSDAIDQLLYCNDILSEITSIDSANISTWSQSNSQLIRSYIEQLTNIHLGKDFSPIKKESVVEIELQQTSSSETESLVRVSTKRINKLVSLAGELTVSSNRIREYSDSIISLKRKHNEILDQIDRLRSLMQDSKHSEVEIKLITSIQQKADDFRDNITSKIISLEKFDRQSSNIASQINHEIIASRMRPFGENCQGYKRLVRDLCHTLKKKIKLHIVGENTAVDRDILEKLDAPLNHMIRNAIDHGIESPAQRLACGKPEHGLITITASHQSGRLRIQIKDDGQGVDIEVLRKNILSKNLVNANMAEHLSKAELLDFLFLPSFSTRSEVTELSGRGVGLDVVHSALQEVRGKLHADTTLGKGMEINMELPLSLSVIRSLIVSISNELYAFPLAKIQSLIKISKQDISTFEDKQYITINGNHIGLIHCAQILGIENSHIENEIDIPVIIIGDWKLSYGLVVDQLIGERGLALRTLNKKLGKVKDISAAAITDDGEPVLIFDTDDLLQSIQDIVSGKNLYKVASVANFNNNRKRVLVVDDSLTVREIEKKLLESRDYLVDIAIDGVDGWNIIRSGNYDLVITDVDMPRMNGIEFITLIKNDAALRSIPVMMVSYKDRPEDKQKGLDAGADYYLTKGSFHDDTLLDAVVDLIGEAKD